MKNWQHVDLKQSRKRIVYLKNVELPKCLPQNVELAKCLLPSYLTAIISVADKFECANLV